MSIEPKPLLRPARAPEKQKLELGEEAVVNELVRLVSHFPVDEVYVTLSLDRHGPLVKRIAQICEEQGVNVNIEPKLSELLKLRISRSHVKELQGVPLLSFQTGPRHDWSILVKRLLDIAGSVFLITLFVPLFVIISILIKLDSPGPILFRQTRIGLNKRRFKMMKFRTMTWNAVRLQEKLEEMNEADGPVFKIREDPRVTWLGKTLRRFSLDELPQLLNVFMGEMSLVGPRPLPLRDVKRIDQQWHRRRFSVKPGLTCIWQVSGRSEIDFDQWAKMDLDYIDNWSLALDLKLLLKTIPAVLRGSGAY